eukprot:4243176-Ditylum_brightwellii.AAC.1
MKRRSVWYVCEFFQFGVKQQQAVIEKYKDVVVANPYTTIKSQTATCVGIIIETIKMSKLTDTDTVVLGWKHLCCESWTTRTRLSSSDPEHDR